MHGANMKIETIELTGFQLRVNEILLILLTQQ